MSYKTLIIIDNSNELTTLNRQIIKETVKSFIRNTDRENKVALAVTGEKAEYLTDYEDSLNTQLKTVDDIIFKDINAPGADVLMEVLLSWKESDVAYRDILYIGCREVALGGDYSEEELLFEVNNKQYPIYTLACAQNNNSSLVKGLSSLSRISGGTSVSTEDALSDAEVEKQLSEMLLKAMQERRSLEQETYNEEKEVVPENTDTEIEESTISELEEMEDNEEHMGDSEDEELESTGIMYETTDSLLKPDTGTGLIYPVIIIIAAAIIFSLSIFFKRIKRDKDEKKHRQELVEKIQKNKSVDPFEDVLVADTVCLNSTEYNAESDTGTRLLFQTKEGIDITLEDRANPTKYFRACVRDSIVIGRNDKVCDIPITYDDSISSRHCEICQREGTLYCRDLGSSNGTMINQQKIYQEVKIESGDILRIGRLSFFVQIVGDSYAG